MNFLTSRIVLSAIAILFTANASATEPITVTVSKVKDINLRIYGYVETDYIFDTTEGYTELQGNYLVPARTTIGGAKTNYAGQHDRSQMSIRNSRLGFELNLPKTEFGLQTQGIIELDLSGNNAPNTAPGSTPSTQSEGAFFNNPALRARHAYLNLTYKEWNAKLGQTWSLFGWQPYYFPGELVTPPTPGVAFGRYAQARLTHTYNLNDSWTLESAVDAAKPAEMNSGSPEYHAGLRLASTKYKGTSMFCAGTSMVGLSAAVSAALIPVRTALGNANGGAVIFDVLIPIIPSSDGKDRSNTLVLAGEVMSGSGVGGVEYPGLTSGVPALSATSTGTAVDAGIAGLNNGGNLSLIRYRAFRSHLQYSLPRGKWAISAGYSQVETRNLADFGMYAGTALLSPKTQFGYADVFYDPFAWLRFSAEFNQTRVTYVDAANRFAVNNRVQLAAFLIF